MRNSTDHFGRTPLIYCILADRLNTAKYLIKSGAQIGCVDNHGRSAVHIAAHKGTTKFLHLLAQKGADFSSADQDGQTPLHLATNARNHDGSCVKYLLKRLQPDFIDIKDHHGRCPLHCAAIFANVEAVRVLLKANANPDQCDELGMTPLHYAAENPNGVKAAEILLNSASYALLNWQDHRGRTALHLAIKESNIDVANLLIQRKCDVSLSDNKNRSALHWAAQLGRVDFVTNLIKGIWIKAQIVCHLLTYWYKMLHTTEHSNQIILNQNDDTVSSLQQWEANRHLLTCKFNSNLCQKTKIFKSENNI